MHRTIVHANKKNEEYTSWNRCYQKSKPKTPLESFEIEIHLFLFDFQNLWIWRKWMNENGAIRRGNNGVLWVRPLEFDNNSIFFFPFQFMGNIIFNIFFLYFSQWGFANVFGNQWAMSQNEKIMLIFIIKKYLSKKIIELNYKIKKLFFIFTYENPFFYWSYFFNYYIGIWIA